MISLYNQQDFKTCASRGKLPLSCAECKQTFYLGKNEIQAIIKDMVSPHPKKKKTGEYCSLRCAQLGTQRKKGFYTFDTFCGNCGAAIQKQTGELRKSKSGYIFCGSACAATYNNKHKTYGGRVSKLELYLQDRLTKQMPSTEIHFNRKDAIGSELDIYLPSFKVAIEINGIFHYKDIYGNLDKVQKNDREKELECKRQNIKFFTIKSIKNFSTEEGDRCFKEVCNILQ